MKAKVNPSLNKKMNLLEQTLEEKKKDSLVDIAQFAVSRSPVDTGAYVTSFSFKNSWSSGRSRTSRGKPRFQDPTQKRQEGFSQLVGDINAMDMDSDLFVLSNGSPHATKVERVHGYAVFAQIKDKFR